MELEPIPPEAHLACDFYFGVLKIDDFSLSLEVGSWQQRMAKIAFPKIASALFYKESDRLDVDSGGRFCTLIRGRSADVGLFRVDGPGLIDRIGRTFADSDEAQIYLVASPDECVEVVAHEYPLWMPL